MMKFIRYIGSKAVHGHGQ